MVAKERGWSAVQRCRGAASICNKRIQAHADRSTDLTGAADGLFSEVAVS